MKGEESRQYVQDHFSLFTNEKVTSNMKKEVKENSIQNNSGHLNKWDICQGICLNSC